MRVIFLDVDGVLNHKCFDDEYMSNYNYNNKNEIVGVDPEKVKILAKICEETYSKVVLSSSWKLGLEHGYVSKSLYRLVEMLYDNGIDLIDVTSCIPNPSKGGGQEMWKEWDIECYLHEHPEVTKYCIFDDETYDLLTKKDHLIQTDWKKGILPEHVNEVRRIYRKGR